VAPDELLRGLSRLVVRALRVGRLHEIGARAVQLAGDAGVERELAAAHGVRDDAGRVRGVPHLELELRLQRHVAEGLALEPDVRPLAVREPRDVVRRPDVDVVRGQLVAHDRGDGLRLGDLLGLQPVALEHVVEVHVAAHVELGGAQQLHAAVVEEAGQRAVHDGGADLRLDVVADDGQPGLQEAVVPVVLARDEHGNAVHEAAARLDDLLHVPLGGLLRADREVRDDDVRARVVEHLGDVHGRSRGLGDLLRQVAAQAVVGHAAHDLHARGSDLAGEVQRVVLAGEDGLGEVLAHLRAVDVEGGGELDVAHVVAAEVDVHEAGNRFGGIGVAVVLDALDEGRRAVADADDGDADLLLLIAAAAVAVHMAPPSSKWPAD
jgi:hypothetical protein